MLGSLWRQNSLVSAVKAVPTAKLSVTALVVFSSLFLPLNFGDRNFLKWSLSGKNRLVSCKSFCFPCPVLMCNYFIFIQRLFRYLNFHLTMASQNRKFPRPFVVSVEGNIGSGKSSFLNYFQSYPGVKTFSVILLIIYNYVIYFPMHNNLFSRNQLQIGVMLVDIICSLCCIKIQKNGVLLFNPLYNFHA